MALLGFFRGSLYSCIVAGASDDDVQDGDTTAAGIAPAASSADDDEEDRTVQQPPDPKIRTAIANGLKGGPPTGAAPGPSPKPTPLAPQVGMGKGPPRAPVAVPSASKPGSAPTSNVTSKKMTFVGIAPPAAGSAAAPPALTSVPMITKNGPPSAPRPASMAAKPPVSTAKPAPPPPSSLTSPNAQASKNEAEEEDASITATAPAPRVGAATAASTGVAVPPSAPIKPPPLPLTLPGPVQIREMPPPMEEQEPLDETEVRTVVSGPLDPTASTAAPAAKPTPSTAPEADVEDDDEIEDSVTTQAPSQVVGGHLPEDDPDEPKTSPPMRMPPPIPAAGRSPFDNPPIPSAAAAAAPAKKAENEEDDEDAYNVEDSVTTRGPAVPDFKIGNDDSVTADSPVVDNGPESSGRWPSPIGARAATMSQALGLPPKAGGLPPAIEDGTEGTTNRFAGQGPSLAGVAASAKKGGPPRPTPATMASPAALNLPPKVGAAIDADEDDLQEDNRTAVMIGAPVKPGGPIPGARARAMGGGMGTHLSAGVAARATAPAPDPGSESGLRVAPHEQQQPPPQDERASVGAMMSGALMHHGATSDRGSGVAPREYPSQPLPQLAPHMMPHHFPASEPNLALGATIPASSAPLLFGQGMPPSQMQQYDFASTIKKPRYGLLVGLVALLSFAIPLVLFLWLHQTASEPPARVPAEVASDKVGLVPPPSLSIAPASAPTPHGKAPPRRR